jgi:hypothetical protein
MLIDTDQYTQDVAFEFMQRISAVLARAAKHKDIERCFDAIGALVSFECIHSSETFDRAIKHGNAVLANDGDD